MTKKALSTLLQEKSATAADILLYNMVLPAILAIIP